VIIITFICLLLSINIAYADTNNSEQAKCLKCHAEPGAKITFENNETLSVYVNPADFEDTVHKDLSCSDCHPEFKGGQHPKRRFRTKEQYRIRASLVCRRCHPEEKICKKPIHARLMKKEHEGIATSICADCHGAHSVKPVEGGEVFETERNYCMSCHHQDFSLTFQNGEKLPLKVHLVYLERSVHRNLVCSDCHYWFSRDEHPERHFRSKKDYIIALSETCKRCHFDKYTKVLESIHYRILAQGNKNAPVCVDCHGGHDVIQVSKKKNLIVQKCRKCHSEIYQKYAKSIHGRALFEASIQDVPICIDCHRAHDVENPLTLEFHERIPEMCSNCHSNKALMSKYGLSTKVVTTYLSDFHGITLGFYKKQREELYKPTRPIAVCTDCHGIHDISSTRTVDPKTLKANLVKRCRKCHQSATENFPDAWLYHYEPSLKKAPCVFLVNLFYKLFTPFLLVGLGLQILLHIWRYAINR